VRNTGIVADEACRETRQPCHHTKRLIAKSRNPARDEQRLERVLRWPQHDERSERRRECVRQRGEIFRRPILVPAPAPRKKQYDPRITKAESDEYLLRFSDVAREHFYMRVGMFLERLAALSNLVEIAGGYVARDRGTKGVEADDCGWGGSFERAAKTGVVGGEERIDVREWTKKPSRLSYIGIFGE
jgi:hypothetical protein